MAGRTRSHSEARWALLPPTVIRCNATRPNGGRCKREAEDGAVVCDQHGGAAPQVRRRAAERLIMTADEAVGLLIAWMRDQAMGLVATPWPPASTPTAPDRSTVHDHQPATAAPEHQDEAYPIIPRKRNTI
jgi:hypothetical protein